MPTDPEAVRLATALAAKAEAFRLAKVDVEMIHQLLDAKGLLPDAEGNPPASLGVDASGCVGGALSRDSDTGATTGSTIPYRRYLEGLMGFAVLLAAAQRPIYEGGPTAEKAILALARG